MGILSVLLGASIVLQLVNPQIMRQFLDAATSAAPGSLTGLAVLFLVLAVGQQTLAVAATYVSEQVAGTATNALRTDLVRHCIRLDPDFHKTRTPGELIERIDGDVTAMANFFSQFVIQIVGSLLLLVGVLGVLFTVDWRVGAVLSVFALLILALMVRLRVIAVPYWSEHRQASADLFGFIEERLGGLVDLRANGAEAYTMRRLYGWLRVRLMTGRKARVIGGIGWSVPSLAEAGGYITAFVLAAMLYREGNITIGTAFLIYYYTQLMFQPLNRIAHQIDDFQKAGAGIVRVEELRNIRSRVLDGPGAPLPAGPLAVEFGDMSFAYEDDDTPVLRDLNLRLAPGERLGLLGRTGSGKTTLARLLVRLYDPTGGRITLGGHDLRDLRRADLRTAIGMVTQEVQLFRATVRDNLTLFDPAIADERIWEALGTLGLTDWVRGMPQGLDTRLGASGGGLSAGEAQLLAFTRVFLRDPGLIILDEASSRLDPVTERLIERAVDRLLAGRTAIIIAHRLSTVERADTILILEKGEVAEYGARATLVADPDSRFAGLLRTGAAEEVLA